MAKMQRIIWALTALVGRAVASTTAADVMMPDTSTKRYAQLPRRTNKRLTIDTISDKLKKMDYAVRGKIAIEADKFSEELDLAKRRGVAPPHPFDHIIMTNIGNPHCLQQKAISWPRQVLALLQLPDELGVNHPSVRDMFPADAVERAREMKRALDGNGVGAYTHSKGAKPFREDVARFIERRDGARPGSVDVESIFLSSGASEAITMLLTALIRDSACGCMIPIPQYPLYSATLDLLGGKKVGYYLDEDEGWGLNMDELERSLNDAEAKGINVVCLVLINPGNPTGQVLKANEVKDLVLFCARHNIVLLADEVYQENVYEGEFFSCRRAADELGLIDQDAVQLCSFHSVSKGVYGECGQRGGYVEMTGIDSDVIDVLFKLAASKLCSSSTGQAMVSLMVRGPCKGDVSYNSHEKEKRAIYEGLKDRAKIMSRGLDSIAGFSCKSASGAMYCFPRIHHLPEGAIQASEELGMSPDAFYSLDLLRSTGICVVPASGFGQRQGRYGFRTTFLSKESEAVVENIRRHYEEFCLKYV